MANVAIPKPSRKGEPPKPVETVGNIEKAPTGRNVPMQLKIDPAIRREFQAYAASHDKFDNELFVEVWEYYKRNHG